MRPTEYNVIVAPARVAKTLGATGVLHAPDEYVETAEMAMQVGRIVAMSPLAFNYDQWTESEGKPKVGDIVWFARYAGALIEAAFDGQMYRMVKDKDIAAVIEPPAKYPGHTSIDELPLSSRTLNALKAHRKWDAAIHDFVPDPILTVERLRSLSVIDLLRMPWIGKVAVKEISGALAETSVSQCAEELPEKVWELEPG